MVGKKTKIMLGKELDPVLQQIENAIWDYEATVGNKPYFSNEGFRAASKIFMAVFIDKMYDLQEKEGIKGEDRVKMVMNAANEFKELVRKFTGIDTLRMND